MLLVLCAAVVGCGYPRVTGRVVFPDDSHLDRGTVVFENAHNTATGDIQPDGSYSMTCKEKEGVPYGTYRLSIRDEDETRSRVHSRYLLPHSSGLTLDVKGSMTYMMIVEKPDQ